MSLNVEGIRASFWVLVRISQSPDPSGRVVDAIDDDADAAMAAELLHQLQTNANYPSWNLQQHVRLTETKVTAAKRL